MTVRTTLTVIEAGNRHAHDVVVTADSASTVGDLAAAVSAELRRPDRGSFEALAPVVPLSRERARRQPAPAERGTDTLFLGTRSLDPGLSLREVPLRDGCVLTLGGPGPAQPAEPAGVAELRVVGGPAAGGVHRLGLGERIVGLAPIGGVTVADPALADDHLRIVVSPRGVHVAPMPGRAVLREGQPVPAEGVGWQPGELLEAGNTLLALANPAGPDATVRPARDGGLAFIRPPRRRSDAQVPRVQVPVNRASSGRDKKAHIEYAEALARFNADVWLAAHYDARARRQECPDPAELLLTALGPRRRLWERRWNDLDALRLRLGVRSLPAQIDLSGPGAARVQTPDAWAVPVTVSMRELGVLGVAGPAGARAGLARWLLVQAAVLHSPDELSIVVLGADGWEWVRWLPHLRPRHDQDAAVLVGNDAETAAARIAELTALIAARGGPTSATTRGPDADIAPVLVVVDGARSLRQMAGMQAVLSRGPAAGVFAICLEEEEHLLPEECRAVVGFSRGDPARVQLASTGAEEQRDVLADQVSVSYARRLARSLAPLRCDDDEERQAAPAPARLLALLGLDPPTADQIAQRWHAGEATTTALVGVGQDGEFSVDLGQVGPHCLVVGATGAGKSELLQTFIAALVVANRPDALSLVLVDGDGSGAFAEFGQLPHTAGLLTQPDGHTAVRALESLTAEVRRRERRLATPGAADRMLPRLVIVIDEPAPLLQQLPGLSAELVDTARRAERLGIHLVVATARPDEVDSAGIAAISNLRIALRVLDESQSHVAIGAPVAGTIPDGAPGRGYARVGNSTLVSFQAARIAGPSPAEGIERRPAGDAAVAVSRVPWAAAGRPLPPPPQPTQDTERAAGYRADSADLVAAINAAAQQLEIGEARRVWLPPLPDVVHLDDLVEAAGDGAPAGVVCVPYALADLPAEQRRQTVYYDVERDGHLIVVGADRSGRSTLLRTVATGLAATSSLDDVHLHVIDCSSVLSENDAEDLGRLLEGLSRELARRQQLFAGEGLTDIAGQRRQAAPGPPLPYLVVLLDGWEDLQPALVSIVYDLLAAGLATGLRLLLSTDSSGLTGKLATVGADRILLRLNDPADYQLAGADRRRLPAVLPPGRGLRSRDGVEIQVAMPSAGLDRSAAGAGGQPPEEAAQAAPPEAPAAPPSVRVTAAQARALDDTEADPAMALVGVGGQPARPLCLNLVLDGPGLLIAGPAGSGRSTTLATMLHSLLAAGRHAVVLSPRVSTLRDFAGAAGVTAVFDGLAAAEDVHAAWAATASPRVLAVDDLELFGPGSQINTLLAELLAAAEKSGDGILAAGTSTELSALDAGFGVDIRHSRSGVLLAPAAGPAGELFGLTMESLPDEPGTTGPASPGRGWLVRAGTAEPVQVAITD